MKITRAKLKELLRDAFEQGWEDAIETIGVLNLDSDKDLMWNYWLKETDWEGACN